MPLYMQKTESGFLLFMTSCFFSSREFHIFGQQSSFPQKNHRNIPDKAFSGADF